MKKKAIPEKLLKALLQLKLTEKEIYTYIALLEQESTTVQSIAHDSGINRVSVYAALEALHDKGLVSESRRGKRKLYVAEKPEAFFDLLNEKKDEIRAEEELLQNLILPTLRAFNVREENKPQIRFYQGADGIRRVFEQLLHNKEMIDCGSYETAIRVLTEKEEVAYFDEIKRRKIFYRMLLEDTALNRKFGDLSRGIAHTKYLPAGTLISADIVIAGDLTALISYDKKTATVIEDRSIAQAILMYLDFMWARL